MCMAVGRKLEFDKDVALEAAMQTFWKKGYVGTSLSDLTSAMGINKPSMYSAFGNKEQLFIQSTDHYLESVAKKHSRFLYEEGKTVRERLALYMESVIRGQCEQDKPKGCYISLCVTESEGEELPGAAEHKIKEVSVFGKEELESFFKTDEDAIKHELHIEASNNAIFVMSVLNGTSSLARGGSQYSDLEPLITRTLDGLGL